MQQARGQKPNDCDEDIYIHETRKDVCLQTFGILQPSEQALAVWIGLRQAQEDAGCRRYIDHRLLWVFLKR